MYSLLAVFAIIVGICFFVFAKRMIKNSKAVIGINIVGTALIVIGIAMLYLLLSGKVVLPLSKD